MNTDDQKPTTDHKLYDTECRPKSQKPTTTLAPQPLTIKLPRDPHKPGLLVIDTLGRNITDLGYCFKDMTFGCDLDGPSVTLTILPYRVEALKPKGFKRVVFELVPNDRATNDQKFMDEDVNILEALRATKLEFFTAEGTKAPCYKITLDICPEDTIEIL